MTDPDSAIRVLSFSEPRLTSAAVGAMERALREDARSSVLDCSALTHVTAAGLSALLELGRSATGLRELALSGMSRSLTLHAIQAGLSERFTIYTTREAASRGLLSHEAQPCER